jgi:hypothetical protein
VSDAEPTPEDAVQSDTSGWLAAGLVILAILAIAGIFWFKYHP